MGQEVPADLEDQGDQVVQEALEDLEVPLQNVQVSQEDQGVPVDLPQSRNLVSQGDLEAPGDQEVLGVLEDQADQADLEDQKQNHPNQECPKLHLQLSLLENREALEALEDLEDPEDQGDQEVLGVPVAQGVLVVLRQQNLFHQRQLNPPNVLGLLEGQEVLGDQEGLAGQEDLADLEDPADLRQNLLVL